MEVETSGWFNLHKDTLMVWEGVCALLVDADVHFFKIRNGNVLCIVLNDLTIRKVSSDGYWSCVEITGILKHRKGSFYYHADVPKNAYMMMQQILDFCNTDISSLLVRLDPDPLRIRDVDWISERIATWSQFGRSFCNDARIVFDSNMPL